MCRAAGQDLHDEAHGRPDVPHLDPVVFERPQLLEAVEPGVAVLGLRRESVLDEVELSFPDPFELDVLALLALVERMQRCRIGARGDAADREDLAAQAGT